MLKIGFLLPGFHLLGEYRVHWDERVVPAFWGRGNQSLGPGRKYISEIYTVFF
jgi:hypothetical protein